MKFSFKNTLGTISVVLGIIVSSLYAYSYFFPDKPAIDYEILSNSKILDSENEIKGLKIILNDKDISSERENISIITLKVTNTGNVVIREDSFYDKHPLGFSVEDGEIIGDPVISIYSNPALRASVVANKLLNSRVEFNKFIFEKGLSFIVEVQVIHQKNETPKITPIGKIIDIDNISLIESYPEKKHKDPFDSLFFGGWETNLLRSLIFMIPGLVIFLVIIYTIILVSVSFRKNIAKEFVNSYKKEITINDFRIVVDYIVTGKDSLYKTKWLSTEELKLNGNDYLYRFFSKHIFFEIGALIPYLNYSQLISGEDSSKYIEKSQTFITDLLSFIEKQ
jgi:hypothetical protein